MALCIDVVADSAAAVAGGSEGEALEGFDDELELEEVASFSLGLEVLVLMLVVVVVSDGTSGAASDANTPALTGGAEGAGGAGGVGAAGAAPPGIVLGILLKPGAMLPVMMNVLPKKTVYAPAPSALNNPGAPQISPAGPADSAAALTKVLRDVSVTLAEGRGGAAAPPYE
jgi:hypothetical protein